MCLNLTIWRTFTMSSKNRRNKSYIWGWPAKGLISLEAYFKGFSWTDKPAKVSQDGSKINRFGLRRMEPTCGGPGLGLWAQMRWRTLPHPITAGPAPFHIFDLSCENWIFLTSSAVRWKKKKHISPWEKGIRSKCPLNFLSTTQATQSGQWHRCRNSHELLQGPDE